MRTNIKATGLELTPEVTRYSNKRMRKIEKELARDDTAVAQLEVERIQSHDAGQQFRAELTLVGANLLLRFEATERSLHAALDVLENHALAELHKAKGKRQHVWRKQAQKFKEWVRFGRKQI
jgi:ribosomal subunit interface protein